MFFCLFLTKVLVDFIFFGLLDRSYLSTKKRKLLSADIQCVDYLIVHELHRVRKIKSKFEKLMGAWPI